MKLSSVISFFIFYRIVLIRFNFNFISFKQQ